MLNAKATNDHIDDADDEDKDSGGIVENISSLLVILIIDINTTNYEEEDSQQHLKQLQDKDEILSCNIPNYLKNDTCNNEHQHSSVELMLTTNLGYLHINRSNDASALVQVC